MKAASDIAPGSIARKSVQRIAKLVAGLALFIVLIGGVTAIAYWSPDLPRDQVEKYYTNEESKFFVTALGDRIHYRDQGKKNGPALVLIHGTSASLHTWEPLISELSDSFRLISFDLPGHGLTGEFLKRDYSRTVMVDSLFELLTQLRVPSATLVGNSLGGGIAWQAAVRKSDRVKALILLAPSGAKHNTPSESNIGFRILSTELGQALMQKITPRVLIEKSLTQTVVDPALITEQMTDRYWHLLTMQGNRRAMVDLVHSDRNVEAFDALSNLMTPTLLVWGEEDRLLPVDMIRQFEEALNVSQSAVLTNIGHLPQEEAVVTLAKLISEFCEVTGC